MPPRRRSMPETDGRERPRRRTATTPEGRENQLVALAYDLVEDRIRQGTATSQEVTHFLKLGSTREQLEQQKLRYENELLNVKREAIEDAKHRDDLYVKAINAMRSYSGFDPIETEDD